MADDTVDLQHPSAAPTPAAAQAAEVPSSRAAPPAPEAASGLSADCVLVGDYEHVLRRPLGTGGFGDVWLAETRTRLGPEHPVAPVAHTAVKVFKAARPEQVEFMARRELLGLKSLDDPHIVRVVDYSLERHGTFIALEYHPAGSVLQQPSLRPPISVPAVAAIGRDVLRGLVAAHRASILHLDLKPHNILVGADGRYLLADFGISQGSLVPWRLASPGGGTPGFRAPEQARMIEAKVDARTDVWGFGATIWSLASGIDLAGMEPFRGIDWDRDRFGFPALSAYRHAFPPALEAVIMQCVATRVEERPGSAAQLLAAFEAALEGAAASPVEGLPSGSGQRVTDQGAILTLSRQLLDPICLDLLRTHAKEGRVFAFRPGETMIAQGEASHHALFLLKGRVEIIAGAQVIAREEREGLFLGDVAALLGTRRTATVRAETECWAVLLYASDLERVIGRNPPLALRLAKSLADRLARVSAPSPLELRLDGEPSVAERVRRTARRGGPTDPGGTVTPAVARLWQLTHTLGLWHESQEADVFPWRSFAAWHDGLFSVGQASESYTQPKLWGARMRSHLAREASSFSTPSHELLGTMMALVFLREKLHGRPDGRLEGLPGMHTERFRLGLLCGAALSIGVVLTQRVALAPGVPWGGAGAAARIDPPGGFGALLQAGSGAAEWVGPAVGILALLVVAALLFAHALTAFARRRLIVEAEATFLDHLDARPDPPAVAARRSERVARRSILGAVTAFEVLALGSVALWLQLAPVLTVAAAVAVVSLVSTILLAASAPSAAMLRRSWREAVARIQGVREQRRRRT